MFNDFFSSNLIALSDDQARIELRGDLLVNSYSSYFDGFFDGVSEFAGVCLSNPISRQQNSIAFSSTDLYFPIKIRPLDIHNFIIPDPCATTNSAMTARLLVSAHPLAFSERPAGHGERPPVFGDILSFRMASSPKGSGKVRSIRYSYPKNSHQDKYRCANQFITEQVVLQSLTYSNLLGPPPTPAPIVTSDLRSLNSPSYKYDYHYKFYYEGNTNSRGKFITSHSIKVHYPPKKAFHERHDDIFRRAAKKYKIQPALLKAVSWAENALKDKGCSGAGACGIMQFVKKTALEQGLVVNATTDERNIPEKAIFAAAKYLRTIYNSKYVKNYSGEVKWAMTVAAYNTGMGNVGKHKFTVLSSRWNCKNNNCGETGKYVARVISARDYLLNEQGFQ